MSEPRALETTCCIAGGGPAGVMLGYLLARAGVDVVVLEKHADFLRDFRGDTVHPSTLEVMHELGILDRFLDRPHQKVSEIRGKVGGLEVAVADFSHLPTRCKFIAMMPQWHFLNFLAQEGREYPTFHLLMEAKFRDLLYDGDKVAGVRAVTPQGRSTSRAPYGGRQRRPSKCPSGGLEGSDSGGLQFLGSIEKRPAIGPNLAGLSGGVLPSTGG